jgi:hypothetical protein
MNEPLTKQKTPRYLLILLVVIYVLAAFASNAIYTLESDGQIAIGFFVLLTLIPTGIQLFIAIPIYVRSRMRLGVKAARSATIWAGASLLPFLVVVWFASK